MKSVEEIFAEADAHAAQFAGDTPRDWDSTVRELAALTAADYEFRRAPEARRLKVRVSALDAAVTAERAKRNGASGETAGQGQALDLRTPEPWPEPVDAAAVFAELALTFQRHVVLPPHGATACALWTVLTYMLAECEVSPRLALLSATMRCGKTTLLSVFAELVCRPLAASNISPAAIFRTVEAAHPTLLIDEADSFARENNELRGLLNSGHTRATAYAVRCVGDDSEPRQFSTWCAIAVAAIGSLPATWLDRSIVLRLKRRLKSERVARLDKRARAALGELARKVARLALDSASELSEAEPPAGLNDRAADNWRPLLAIAELGGPAWVARTRTAAMTLSGANEADDSLSLRLLTDTKAVFRAEERLGSTEITGRLVALELSPWATITRGRALTPAKLARLLRPFEIFVAEDTHGSFYRRAAFVEAWRRYLDGGDEASPEPPEPENTYTEPDPPSQSAIVPQPLRAVGDSSFSEVPCEKTYGTLKSATNPTESKTNGTMADRNPPDSPARANSAPGEAPATREPGDDTDEVEADLAARDAEDWEL